MPDLIFDNLPELKVKSERVDVPEILTDENGDPYYVMVRGLTVHEWNLILSEANKQIQLSQNGDLPADIEAGLDELCHVAAIASYDDLGRRVFGANRIEATKRLMAMPMRCRPAILRIYRTALKLTDIVGTPEETIKEAKKK